LERESDINNKELKLLEGTKGRLKGENSELKANVGKLSKLAGVIKKTAKK